MTTGLLNAGCLILVCLIASGCARSQPMAAQVQSGTVRGETAVLNPQDQAAVRAGLRSFAGTRPSKNPPARARFGKRWLDIPIAVAYATDDIEAAVVRRLEHDLGYTFILKTVEDWPGMLDVRRTNDDTVYTATADIGWRSEHIDRAEALIAALEKHMLDFGKKRAFTD